MNAKCFNAESRMLQRFMGELIQDPIKREQYIKKPRVELQKHGLGGYRLLYAKREQFYQFVSDDKVWTAIKEKNNSRIKYYLMKKYPQLMHRDSKVVKLALTSTLVVHDAVVGSQSVVVALALIKAVAAGKGK